MVLFLIVERVDKVDLGEWALPCSSFVKVIRQVLTETICLILLRGLILALLTGLSTGMRPCQIWAASYLQHIVKTSWQKPLLQSRKYFLRYWKMSRAKFLSENFVNFQKYLNFNRSNLLARGSTPHRSRTSSGGEFLGALIRDFSVCV